MAEEPFRGGSILARVGQDGWRPTSLELIRDGYLALVVQHRPPRWRWAVAPLVVVERIPSQIARGYTKSFEAAMETAEAAIEALKASVRSEETPWASVPCPASVYGEKHHKNCALCKGSGTCNAADANAAIKKAWLR